MKKKSSLVGSFFLRPDFLILGLLVVFGVLLVGGLTPFNFKNTPPTEGEFVAEPVIPDSGDKSLQLRTIKFKQCSGTLAIEMVLDRSNSMMGTKINDLKEGARNFVYGMPDEGLMGLVTFSTKSTPLQEINKVGIVKTAVVSQINAMNANGNTNHKEALEDAKKHLQKVISLPEYKEYSFNVIFLSDGGYTVGGPPFTVAEEIKNMKSANGKNVRIFSIAYGSGADKNTMVKIASPNSMYEAPNSNQIKSILSDITDKICK